MTELEEFIKRLKKDIGSLKLFNAIGEYKTDMIIDMINKCKEEIIK